MPSILALIITITFIIFLLRLDRKQNQTSSPALWLPTFWMLLATSRTLGSWTGLGSGFDEGSVLDRIVLSGLVLVAIPILIKRRFNWSSFLKDNMWLIIVAAFMLLSITWSEMPFLSFKRWFKVIGVMIIMGCLVASEVDPRQALMSIFRRIAYIHIPLSILLIKYYPHLGVQWGRWTGEVIWGGASTFKNGLAQTCYFVIFFYFWTFLRRRRGLDKAATWYQKYLEYLIVIVAFWLFMGPRHTLTYSSTSLAVLLFGISMLLFLQWLKTKRVVLSANILTAAVLCIIIYAAVTPFLGKLSFIDVSSLLGRNETLTGRSEIWAKVIPVAMEKPMLGHGFCYWTDELDELTKANSSHNGYLETILGLGFIGVILSSIFLISACRKAHRYMMYDFDWGGYWLCLALMAALHDIAEASLNKFSGIYPMIIFIMIVCQYKKPHHSN